MGGEATVVGGKPDGIGGTRAAFVAILRCNNNSECHTLFMGSLNVSQ